MAHITHLKMYKLSKNKLYFLGIPLSILTAGILLLLSVWVMQLRLFLFYTKIEKGKLLEATHILILDAKDKEVLVKLIKTLKSKLFHRSIPL